MKKVVHGFLITVVCCAGVLFSMQGCKGQTSEKKESAVVPVKEPAKPVVQKPSLSKVAPDKFLWERRTFFENMKLRNLHMAWNGSFYVYSIKDHGEGSGEVVTVFTGDMVHVKDWRVETRVNGLYLNGEGKSLLVKLDNGDLLFYSNWKSEEKPVRIKSSGGESLLSPKGGYVVNVNPGGEVKVLSAKGEPAWSNGKKALGSSIYFPFLSNDKYLAGFSNTGEFFMSDGGETLWKTDPHVKPLATASSLLEGKLLAISTGGEKGRVLFYDEKGKLKGSAAFKEGASSLSCSKFGNICAALGNGEWGSVFLYIHLWEKSYGPIG